MLDLFSGIGGFSLGLERTGGFETIAFCEIDLFCRKVLNKHWPDVPIYEDIRELDGNTIRADVITGGYPCQPFSVAGKQLGDQDKRHLWPAMFRVIQAIRPRYVIAENVGGHIQLGLDTVIAQMEAENYTVWPFVIPACAVGAPHRRDRIWIISRYSDKRNWNERPIREMEERQNTKPAGVCTNVPDTDTKGSQRPVSEGIQRTTRESCRYSDSSTMVSNTKCERQQGSWEPFQWCGETENGEGQADHVEPMCIGDFWLTEPSVCRVDDGLSDGLYQGRVAKGVPDRVNRLKALGNSIVPQVAQLLAEAILEYEQ